MYPRTKVETSNRGLIATGRVTQAMATAQRSWLQGVLRLIRDDVRGFAPADLGTFRKSIVYRTTVRRQTEVTGEVYSNDPNSAKIAVIEYGRTPGAKMPPKGALLGWMSRKGIDARFEFVIRRAIGRDGIPGKFPFRKAFTKRRSLLASQSRNLQSALTRALA